MQLARSVTTHWANSTGLHLPVERASSAYEPSEASALQAGDDPIAIDRLAQDGRCEVHRVDHLVAGERRLASGGLTV